MHKVAQFTVKQREELFSETARKMGTTNAIVEKDLLNISDNLCVMVEL